MAPINNKDNSSQNSSNNNPRDNPIASTSRQISKIRPMKCGPQKHSLIQTMVLKWYSDLSKKQRDSLSNKAITEKANLHHASVCGDKGCGFTAGGSWNRSLKIRYSLSQNVPNPVKNALIPIEAEKDLFVLNRKELLESSDSIAKQINNLNKPAENQSTLEDGISFHLIY